MSAASELLFSYGTLQQENVQRTTFGRPLDGEPDELLMYQSSLVAIEDPGVVAMSGRAQHPIVRFTGNPAHRVPGTLFRVTPEELVRADGYEVAAYRRVSAALASGKTAWVYVDARPAPP